MDSFWESQLVSTELLHAQKERQTLEPSNPVPECLFFTKHRKYSTEGILVFSHNFLSERTWLWILLTPLITRIKQFHVTGFPGISGPRSYLPLLTFCSYVCQKGRSSEMKVLQGATSPFSRALMGEVAFCLLLMLPSL